MISITDYQRKELVFKFLEIEIMLNRKLKAKEITKQQEKEIRLKLKPLRYLVHLNSPKFKNNEKLKKEIEILCINDFIGCIGLGKDIRYINCQDST
ncbi:MAG: hypothetical protein ABH849_03925 [Nanoarchaeota archaeon]